MTIVLEGVSCFGEGLRSDEFPFSFFVVTYFASTVSNLLYISCEADITGEGTTKRLISSSLMYNISNTNSLFSLLNDFIYFLD